MATDIAGADVARGVTLPRLQEARRRVPLTQDQLAAQAGVSIGSVWRAERGDPVAVVTAQKIAAALGVPTASLMAPAE